MLLIVFNCCHRLMNVCKIMIQLFYFFHYIQMRNIELLVIRIILLIIRIILLVIRIILLFIFSLLYSPLFCILLGINIFYDIVILLSLYLKIRCNVASVMCSHGKLACWSVFLVICTSGGAFFKNAMC
jgi:hypothetical protein